MNDIPRKVKAKIGEKQSVLNTHMDISSSLALAIITTFTSKDNQSRKKLYGLPT